MTILEDSTEPETIYHELTVLSKNNGGRIDKFIADNLENISRGQVKNLCGQNLIKIDNTPITDPAFKVKLDQVVHITIPAEKPVFPTAQAMNLDILFEDQSLIILNKPAGLTVHPGAGTVDQTLVNGLLHHTNNRLSFVNTTDRAGIVHRLDKDTSGVMVVAKTDIAHEHLAGQFFNHTNTRLYYALVRGHPKQKSGIIKSYIGRNRHQRKKMAIVGDGGKWAVTHWKTVETIFHKQMGILSLVECQLETGRTHQIRVHMAHQGHPVIGDPLYGSHDKSLYKFFPKNTLHQIKSFPRQALHAYKLGIIHPETQTYIEYQAPAPNDFQELLLNCGFKNNIRDL